MNLRDELRALLEQIERHCPCGARPESPSTHPHVGGCPVAAAASRGTRLDERPDQGLQQRAATTDLSYGWQPNHRQGCECLCCDHSEGSECACECHASGACSFTGRSA